MAAALFSYGFVTCTWGSAAAGLEIAYWSSVLKHGVLDRSRTKRALFTLAAGQHDDRKNYE